MSSDSLKRRFTGISEVLSDSLSRFSPDVEVDVLLPLDSGPRLRAVVVCGDSCGVTAELPSQGLDRLLSPLKGTDTSVMRLFGAAAFSVPHNPGTPGGITSLP